MPETTDILQEEIVRPKWELHCPAWCGTDHDDWEQEPEDLTLRRHLHLGPGDHLEDLLNQVDGRVLRTAGGGWDTALVLFEKGLAPGKTRRMGTFVELDLHRGDGPIDRLSMQMTSGEARTMAAALVHMAELAEGIR